MTILTLQIKERADNPGLVGVRMEATKQDPSTKFEEDAMWKLQMLINNALIELSKQLKTTAKAEANDDNSKHLIFVPRKGIIQIGGKQ